MFAGINVSLCKNCMTHVTFFDVILRTLSGRAPQVMNHRLGLFVAPYLLRQLSRSPCFPYRITCVSSFPPSNRYPGFNSHIAINTLFYYSLHILQHFSTSRGATNKRCLFNKIRVRSSHPGRPPCWNASKKYNEKYPK